MSETSDYNRYAAGDRDQAARDAKAAHERERRALASRAAGRGTPADEDKRTVSVTIRLSAREAAELDKQAGTDTRSAFTRDVLLAELGVEDTARRPTRRRRAGKTKAAKEKSK